MRTLRVPAGITSLSHGDEQYFPNEQGLVEVSDAAADILTRPPHSLEEVEAPALSVQPKELPLSVTVTMDADASASEEG